MKSSYLIKIVPPWGYRVWRLEFTPRKLAFGLAISLATMSGIGSLYYYSLHHAQTRVGELRQLTESQHERLKKIDAEASVLDGELRALEKQNEQIRKMIGADGKGKKPSPITPSRDDRQSFLQQPDDFKSVTQRIERLRADSNRLKSEGNHLRTVALHVLNMRRLEDLARARLLAAIPSLNPTGYGGIASGFGWRWSPWPEFHRGVDLVAGWGDEVRATAAGTVISAGWDGGYGIKVDIDHGNGYHTWYAHLSSVTVHPGQYVRKAQDIARVGSTGSSTGPHLHYQIMLDGSAINPAPYLNGVPPHVLASLH